MSSQHGVQHAAAKAHLASKSTAASFAFDSDSAVMYAVVNLDSDQPRPNASDPAKTQGAQSVQSMKVDPKQQHADSVKLSETSCHSVPIIVAVSATSQLGGGKKGGLK